MANPPINHPINPAKLFAVSKHRRHATAAETRHTGGRTVTTFLVGDPKAHPITWVEVEGYGPTPGQRKTDALGKYRARLVREAEAQERDRVNTAAIDAYHSGLTAGGDRATLRAEYLAAVEPPKPAKCAALYAWFRSDSGQWFHCFDSHPQVVK